MIFPYPQIYICFQIFRIMFPAGRRLTRAHSIFHLLHVEVAKFVRPGEGNCRKATKW